MSPRPPQTLKQRLDNLIDSPATLEQIKALIAATAGKEDVVGPLRQLLEGVHDLRLQFEEMQALRDQVTHLHDLVGQSKRAVEAVRHDVEFMKSKITTYIGNEVALTYLSDETPIYVNSHDFGGSVSELLNGGEYEPNNLEVLLSFVRDDTTFLDVGANVGFFTLQVAKRVRHAGAVYAIEPHPELARLVSASAFLNGLSSLDGKSGTVVVRNIGASDQSKIVSIHYPIGHLGGGTVGQLGDRAHTSVQAQLHPLDRVFARNFKRQVIKIDVEGHELNVLRGMKRMLECPDTVIMFEKLGARQGNEGEIETMLRAMGFDLYLIEPNARLAPIDNGELGRATGYIIAARGPLEFDRRRFSIYPRQFTAAPDPVLIQDETVLMTSRLKGRLMFHGPYWFLRRGTYKVVFHGNIPVGTISVMLAGRMGHCEVQFDLSAGQTEATVAVPSDIVLFECVVRAASDIATVNLKSLELIRVA